MFWSKLRAEVVVATVVVVVPRVVVVVVTPLIVVGCGDDSWTKTLWDPVEFDVNYTAFVVMLMTMTKRNDSQHHAVV